MTEKNLDCLLARFPILLIEGLRKDIEQIHDVNRDIRIRSGGKQLVLGLNPRRIQPNQRDFSHRSLGALNENPNNKQHFYARQQRR